MRTAPTVEAARRLADEIGEPVKVGCVVMFPEVICDGPDCTDPNCENCRDDLYPMLPVRELAEAVTTVPRFEPKDGLTFRDLLALWKLEDGDS